MGGRESVEQFMYATCANLLAYPDAGGRAGSVLRPEIAAAMPKVTNGERTYTFRIRPGFRFSPPSNEPLTALTFSHTLERSLSPKNQFSAGPFWASDIAGVSPYRAGTARHISGVSAHGNTLKITLVRPAGDFLTRLSMLAFCPVPLSVPVHTKGFSAAPIPSAGPYYVASTGEHRTVLARNPNYHGDRPRKSARIVYTNDVPTPQAAALANAGSIDLLPQDFDNTTPLLNPYDVLDQRAGAGSAAARRGQQQYFLYSAPYTDYIVLNAGRPLFRDGRLRRAVNFAIDRAALGRAYGDAPADEIVPPAVPGYRAGSTYPLAKPDLGAARRLAGLDPRPAVLYWCGGDERQRTLAGIIRSDLARIGIRVRVDQAPQCPASYDARAHRADLLLVSGLGSQELDPQPLLEQALAADGHYGSALGSGVWTSRSFRSRLERARLLGGPARARAYAALVAELTRAAPFAVYGSFVWSEYFSPHVGCKLFQGEYGFADLGALCKH
jgi:ABC-type transport system substrate-binding protein